ncbi:hypothetical protein ACP70R_024770 [Stipagrostis hirtigluma subsp. patula]
MADKKPKRPSVKVDQSQWTGYFINPHPLPCSHQPGEAIKDRHDELVQKVRFMIRDCTSNEEKLLQGMKIVDALERLGVGYHFEEDITMFMDVLSSAKPVRDNDLFTFALQFRLLRQHRYDVTCEVFKNFMDENGSFNWDTLRSNADAHALLSLYEAAQLGKRDESSLRGAMVFTTECLSSLANSGLLPEPVLERVRHSLASPTHRRMKRLEAKLYISIYENSDGDSRDDRDDVLELAKLDFHILQQMHRDEVKSFSLWYNDLNPAKTLSGPIRERPVECYFWALGIFYEPHYAKARMAFARFVKMFSLFDDTFDSYGTLDELHRFNQAVQSWDVEGAKQVGKCYGYVMSHLSETLEELEANAGASPAGVHRAKEAIKEASKCMLQEVIWREMGQVPPLHDYLSVSAVTTFYWPLACISFLGMDASDGIFTGAIPFPDKIIESAAIACRLIDDISGHECEKERSKCITAVDCYVREHGVTVQEAKRELSTLVDEQWKIMNQEFLGNHLVPTPLLMRVMNFERLMESMYKGVDGYTHPEQIAGQIDKLLNECVYH